MFWFGSSIELLGSGNSDASPLSLSSTAVGDSGVLHLCKPMDLGEYMEWFPITDTDSTYGDVTIYTRLASL